MNVTSLMSRMCLAMATGMILIWVIAGEDRGQVRGDQPPRFDSPPNVNEIWSGFFSRLAGALVP